MQKGRNRDVFAKVHALCNTGSGNDQYPVALAAIDFERFHDLCRMSAEELEGLRAVAGFRTDMWCYATCALAWQELKPGELPMNAPKNP